MRKSLINSFFVALLLLAAPAGYAQLRLARLFSDHAVLQRGKPLPVWGWASPREKITVTLNGTSATATADATGKWLLRLPPQPAGGPHELTVKGKTETLTRRDVLLGDVWLCSGQSNMEWPVSRADSFVQVKAAANVPQIRQFLVSHEVGIQPETDLKSGEWQAAGPELSLIHI